MMDVSELNLTLEDHQKAQKEVSFLLTVFSQTITEMVGKATGSVGMVAGKEAGKKIPFENLNPSINEVLEHLIKYFAGGFDFQFQMQGSDVQCTFGRCVLRNICRNQNLDLGTHLCNMFHSYLAGVVSQLAGKNYSSTINSTADTCQVTLKSV